MPMTAREFREDDDGYQEWLSSNPHGYVINIQRSHNPAGARLHDASCGALQTPIDKGLKLADEYVKVCGGTLGEVKEWADVHAGVPIQDCGICRGGISKADPGDGGLCPACRSYRLSISGKCPSCDY